MLLNDCVLAICTPSVLTVSGQLGLIATGILNLEEDRFGNGRHLWDVKGNDFSEYGKVCSKMKLRSASKQCET